jgi:hypothetical protein
VKKMITTVTVAAMVAGVGAGLAYKELNSASNHSVALAKTFSSIDDIVKDAKVIIKGKVPKEYRKEVVGEIVFHVYDVQVIKLYNNLTDQEIKEGETVEMYRLVGVESKDGKDMANIVAPKYQSLHEGEYLLFLNGQFDDNLNKLILIPNTPNQLFKAEKSSRLASWKSNNTEFENITEDDALPSINEADLLDAIDSLK